MFNKDVATGSEDVGSTSPVYASTGSSSSNMDHSATPTYDTPSCYLWDIMETCTKAQTQMIANGSAILENFILVGYKSQNGADVFFNSTNSSGFTDGSGSSPGSNSASSFLPGNHALLSTALGLLVLHAVMHSTSLIAF